jgi:hypothetical protein
MVQNQASSAEAKGSALARLARMGLRLGEMGMGGSFLRT